MSTGISGTNLPQEWQDRFESLVQLAQEQRAIINELNSRSATDVIDENAVFTYFRLYQDFLRKAQTQNWIVELKYNTKYKGKYVYVDFSKYSTQIEESFDKNERRQFREFLKDLNLIDSETFEAKYGIFHGHGKDRKRVLRIPAQVYNRLTEYTAS